MMSCSSRAIRLRSATVAIRARCSWSMSSRRWRSSADSTRASVFSTPSQRRRPSRYAAITMPAQAETVTTKGMTLDQTESLSSVQRAGPTREPKSPAAKPTRASATEAYRARL